MIRVLIAEDDPMVAQLNRRFVERVDGFEVVGVAANGEEALKYLVKNNVDLVILDVYMPKLDGISLLKEMRKKFIMSDVILVTAATDADDIDAVLKLGAVDYLIKPFEFERLKNALESYLVRRQLLSSSSSIKQEDIDRITKSGSINTVELQKGLHKKTLDRIRRFMRDHSDQYFSSEIVAEQLSMSRVTIRRYLDYLESIDEITLKIEYGSVGRPVHLYKYVLED